MEYEVSRKPFIFSTDVRVVRASDVLDAAIAFVGSAPEKTGVWVREVGALAAVHVTVAELVPDSAIVAKVARDAYQAAFFSRRPESSCHVLARWWMSKAYEHAGRIRDFETLLRATELLGNFGGLVSDYIQERSRERN